jgi:hypothetical protein
MFQDLHGRKRDRERKKGKESKRESKEDLMSVESFYNQSYLALHAPKCYNCESFTHSPRFSAIYKTERVRFCSDKCLKVYKDAMLASVIFGGGVILIKEKTPSPDRKVEPPKDMEPLTL